MTRSATAPSSQKSVVEPLVRQGLKPFHIPLAIDEGVGGTCIRCATCDAYPCRVGAKGDAERSAIRVALRSDNVRLITHARVLRLIADASGSKIIGLEADIGGSVVRVSAVTFVLAAGAINSARILLEFGSPALPKRTCQQRRPCRAQSDAPCELRHGGRRSPSESADSVPEDGGD